MNNSSLLAAALTTLALASSSASANVCEPTDAGAAVVGAPIIVAATAQVEATYCGTEGSFTSDLSLDQPDFQYLATGHVTAEGTTVDLGVFTGGTELVFAIHVRDTGWTYYSGDPGRNPDGQPHAAVTDLGNGDHHVGFEDVFGGGDRDYNDIVFALHVRLDSDDDGLFDDEDACPASEPGALIDASGCSIADHCPCEASWANHGDYVSCVADIANDFRAAGLISGKQRGAIVSSAARSSCGQ